jgi:cytolysin-activating lysine-acyltransferase
MTDVPTTPPLPEVPPELLANLQALRIKAHEVFGRIVIALMAVPRYKHLSLADLQPLVLDPLVSDRIMFAQAKAADGKPDENAPVGIAIWASVSPEVNAKLKEQIAARVFPLRLQQKDWNSGSINWLLDVIAPNPALTEGAVGTFLMLKADEERHIHPAIIALLPPDAPKRLGLAPIADRAMSEKGASA